MYNDHFNKFMKICMVIFMSCLVSLCVLNTVVTFYLIYCFLSGRTVP